MTFPLPMDMDDLECEICCERFDCENRRPRVLMCGHTFCSLCINKEIGNGKRICATCRSPHNANSATDVILNVTLERLIRNMPKTLTVAAKSNDSDDDDEENDFSGGRCTTHRKGDLYFYCETHSVKVCRECTVIDHTVDKCKIISIKQQIEKSHEDEIYKASLNVTAVNEALSALSEFVQEKENNITKQEIEIQNYEKKIQSIRKDIANARKTINGEKTNIEKAQRQISQGKKCGKNLEAAKLHLQNAKTKKTMDISRTSIESVSKDSTTWIKDVSTEFKISSLLSASISPPTILRDLDNNKVISVEKTVNGKKLTAKLSSKDAKLHVHPFKEDPPHGGATVIRFDKVLSHLPSQPPELVFLDLIYRNALQGRVYIQLEPELHDFIKHLPGLFTGENGNSIIGNTCVRTSSYDLAIWLKRDAKGNSIRQSETVTVKTGAVICNISNGKYHAMFFFLGNEYTYDPSFAKIGQIVSGLEVAKACRGIGQQSSISISDCGLVL